MSTTLAPAPLSTADAQLLVDAAHEAAAAADVPVSVTVLDAGGHLLAFRRDDRAVLIAGETSTRKAYTALQLNAPTADLVEAVQVLRTERMRDPDLAEEPATSGLAAEPGQPRVRPVHRDPEAERDVAFVARRAVGDQVAVRTVRDERGDVREQRVGGLTLGNLEDPGQPGRTRRQLGIVGPGHPAEAGDRPDGARHP